MYSLHEALIRLLVTAETRAARESLKEFDQSVNQTAANVEKANVQMGQASGALGEVTSEAGAASSMMGGFASSLAIGGAVTALVAVLAVAGTAFIEYKNSIAESKKAMDDWEDDMLTIGTKAHDAIQQIQFLGKVTEQLAKNKGAKGSVISADEMKATHQQIEALRKTYQDLLADDKKLNAESAKGADVSKELIANAIEEEKIRQEGIKLGMEEVLLNTKIAGQQDEELKKEKEKYVTILEQIKKVEDELDKAVPGTTFQKARNERVDDKGQIIPTTEIKLMQAKIAKAIQDGVADPANAAAFNKLASLYEQQLRRIESASIKLPLPELAGEPSVENEKKIDAEITKLGHEIDKKPLLLTIGGFDQAEVKAKFDEAAKLLEQQMTILGRGFLRGADEAFGGLGEIVGQALTGGLDASLKTLGHVLSSALKIIGEAYVKAGVAALLAKKTFEKFLIKQPELSIAAGIALEAVAGAIASSIGKVKAFATGGITLGPTLSLTGEAGPEAIIPLDRLDHMLSHRGNSRDELTTRVSGQDLIVVINRATKNNNLR